jgi:hypothetical protein
MQMGPYLHPVSRTFGVWSLRILIKSGLGRRWFIVCAISTMSSKPAASRCLPEATSFTHALNFSKSARLAVRSGCSSKNGIYDFEKVQPPLDSVLQEILTVVVVPAVTVDTPDPEELSELLERGRAAGTLGHDEPMNHLIAGLVADPSGPVGLTNEADGEAPFSVYKNLQPSQS